MRLNKRLALSMLWQRPIQTVARGRVHRMGDEVVVDDKRPLMPRLVEWCREVEYGISLHSAAEALGCPAKKASTYLYRLEGRGVLVKDGVRKGDMGRPLRFWKINPEWEG